MVEHHPVGYRHKRLVWALAALDPRKIADPAHELVRTGRRIAGLPGLLAQKPRRKDVIAPPEEKIPARDYYKASERLSCRARVACPDGKWYRNWNLGRSGRRRSGFLPLDRWYGTLLAASAAAVTAATAPAPGRPQSRPGRMLIVEGEEREGQTEVPFQSLGKSWASPRLIWVQTCICRLLCSHVSQRRTDQKSLDNRRKVPYYRSHALEVVPNRNSSPCILLRESFRQDGKVCKRTLANLSKLPPAAIERLRALLRGAAVVEDLADCIRDRLSRWFEPCSFRE